MAGPVAAINVFADVLSSVDARNKSGHDEFGTAWPGALKRDDEQRVDFLAVEHHGALDEAEGGVAHIDAVEIASGGEQAALAVMHDADGDEIRAGFGDPVRH